MHAMIAFIVAFGICFSLSLASLKPLYIAGVFNPYTVDGDVDSDQMQHLSAFLTAINDINTNQTILPGYELKYIIRSAYGFIGAANTASQIASSDYDIIASVGAMPFTETSCINDAFAESETVMVHAGATNSVLGKSDDMDHDLVLVPAANSSALIRRLAIQIFGHNLL